MERAFETKTGVKYRVAVENEASNGRIFIGCHKQLMVDVCIDAEGVAVQITKGNAVLAEAHADAD